MLEEQRALLPDTVLVVDDEEQNRQLLEALLAPEGYKVIQAEDGESAFAVLEAQRVDLVLLDVLMPDIDGIEVCRRIRLMPDLEHLPVILVTALTDNDSRVDGKKVGCDDFLVKPVNRTELLVRVRNLLLAKRSHDYLKQHNKALEEAVVQRIAELNRIIVKLEDAERKVRQSREEVIYRLARASEFRDDDTAHHIQRMSHYCHLLAVGYGLGEDRCNEILIASPLHDVGKIGTPDNILLKPGKLTSEEFEVMKQHAEIGYKILRGSESEMMILGAEIAWGHHEKWDGTGYPRGLRGEEIPPESRIAAIADVFDALSSSRVYRPAFTIEKTIGIMQEGRGKHFDSNLLDLFIASMDKVLAIKEKFAD